MNNEDVHEVIEIPNGSVSEEQEEDDNEIDNEEMNEEMEEEQLEIDMRNNSSAYFDAHKDSIYMVTSHPTLPIVATGGGDDIAYIWTTNTEKPEILATLDRHTESVVAGAFTADGKFLATGDMSGTLAGWFHNTEKNTWECLGATKEAEEVVCIAAHDELPLIAAGFSDGAVWVYEFSDAGTPTVSSVSVFVNHTMPVTAVGFAASPEFQPRVVSCSEDGTIKLSDVYQNTQLYSLEATALRGIHPWVQMAVSGTRKTAAFTSMDGILAIVKLDDGQVMHMLDVFEGDSTTDDEGRSIESVSWSDRGQYLAVGTVEGKVIVYDSKTWKPRTSFQLEDAVTGLKFVDKSPLLVVSGMDGSLCEFDVVANEKVWECYGHNEGVLSFAVQNNGNRIITAGDEHVSLVFNRSPTDMIQQ